MISSKTTAVVRLLIGLFAFITGGVALAADLQISQYTGTPDPVGVSGEVTYSVTAANNSAPSVNNAVVTIAISDRFEVINAVGNFPSYCSVSGAVGSQTLTCNLPTLLGGGAANAQTFTYKAIARVAGTNTTTASIAAAGNTDSNAGNNSLSITPTVRAGADLTVVKAGSAPSVIAGGQLQYTLTVTNNGPTPTAAVRVIDNLPAGSDYQYQSGTGTGWTCSRAGTTVTCNYSGAAPAVGAAYPVITITGKITKSTAGTISNIADVTSTDALVLDPNALNNTSNTVVTNVQAGSDLQAIKSMPSTITVGSSANITLSIRNTGPQSVPAGSAISDVIDNALTPGTMPSGCSKVGQTVTCTAGALSSAQQVDYIIPVTGASATGGIINNTANVAPPSGFADPDMANNTAIAPFQTVLPNADLELYAKYKSPSPVAPGANITSTIIVRNLGPSIASWTPGTPLRVTDTLSADETFVSVSGAWTCGVAGVVVTCDTTDTGTLAVGATKTLTLITTAGSGVDTNVVNTACTDRTAGSAHTPSSPTSPTGNDCRSAGVRSTTSAADLSVQKDVSLSNAGGWTENLAVADTDNVFYIRLRVSNAAGGNTARTIAVTDALPNFINAGSFVTAVTQDSATSGSMSYNPVNGLVVWSLSNLAGGGTETLIIRVQRPFESGSFTNYASVYSSDTTETNNLNNSDTAQYTITPRADMTINSKSVTPDPARVGVPATYIISVRNDGANPADTVQVIDVIDPARFEIIGTPTTTKPGATCSVVVATGTVTCDMGQFVRTEVRQINVTVLPKYPFGAETMATLPTTQVNRATVTTSTLDTNGGSNPNAGNNFFTLNHNMQAPSFDLAVTKQESNPATDDPVRFDETLNYDIRASNFGPSRATDIVVTDIPAPPPGLTMTLSSVVINPVAANGGLTLQAAPSAGCTASGPNYICKINQADATQNYLDPLKQVIFRLVFTMGGTPPSAPTTFTNAAELTSAEQPVWNGAGADLAPANNRATQTTTVRPSTDLEVVSKTRTGALLRNVNEPVEFTIRFRNNGPSTATRVRITDTLPAGFVYAPSPAPGSSIPGGSAATVSGIACSGTTTITCDIDGSFPVGATNTVDLTVNAKAQAPYSGPLAPTDLTDTATITPGLDAFGDPLSEDAVPANDSQTAVVQIRPASLSGTVYADNNDNAVIDGGEGMAGVTVTLSGTDIYGNAVNATAVTVAGGGFTFPVLPPSGPAGYTIVETQPATHYDRNETAGSLGGTVNNAAYGNTAVENTISGIVLPAQTDGTGYVFQDHLKAVIVANDDGVFTVNGLTGNSNVANALTNDQFNGAAVLPAQIVMTVITPATNPGVTLNTSTGQIAVAAGTPAGTYTIDYQICDVADTSTCDPARITVTVSAAPIAAVSESIGGINGLTGQSNVLNALTGDTLNGVAVTTSNVTISVAPGFSVPAGLTFDTATGNVSVSPGTPAGPYTFNYRICEILNPLNCANATETVTVVAAPITAVDDSQSGINGAAGASDVLNVLTGDTLNGAAATTGNVSIIVEPGFTVPAGLVFNTTTGNVSVSPGTAAGPYTFDYRICEILNPANCATATVTITVVAGAITADDETSAPVNGASGATGVVDAIPGDTLNGSQAVIGDLNITVITPATPIGGAPVPVLNTTTGLVDVPAGTPSGSYVIRYQICEKLNPANCALANITVPVVSASITAANDNQGGINGLPGASNVLNVLGGDTLNGVPATTATVNITLAVGSTVPAGLTFDPVTGNVSVSPNTPAGPYSFNYTICEKLNPANCATDTATVTVVAAPIAAVNDSVGGINGASGGTDVLNVLPGDTLNGVPVTTGTVTISVAAGSTVPPALIFDPVTGNISVKPATAGGAYSFNYTICEILNPTNCATATATVTVVAAPISATDDTTAPVNGGTGAPAVIDALPNDNLNGAPATIATVTVAVVTPATPIAGGPVPVLDPATGLVTVPANTPAGTYTIAYQICERLNPANCAPATITVPVTAGPIAATNDTATGINGATGANNVLNVLTGDTRNGTPATTATVDITLAAGSTVPAGLTFDPATGNVSVNPGTPAGTYSFDYTICEKLNPTNCATAKATVTVIPSPIVAVNDTSGDVNSANGGTNVLNAFTGDTINGQPATPTNATVTLAPGAVLPVGFTLDPATGNVTVAPGTPWATYSFDYQLCERLNPTNCTIATITVTVVPPRSNLTGIVYFDDNMNRAHETGERLLENWIVEVSRGGVVVGTARTDAQGFYSVPDLLSGTGYTIVFRNPSNNVVYSKIENATLPVNGTLANQNLPVDPSGVVYDAITRQPVTGALVRLVDTNGAPIPAACFIDPSQASQITGADGFYQFDIVSGAAAQCPAARTEYRLQVTAPTGYADPISTVIAAETGGFNAAGRGNPAPVVAKPSAPQAGDPTTYYMAFLIAQGDGNVVNNHIPLDPFLTRTPLLVTKTSDKRTANTGDLVPYTITVRNTESATRAAVSVVDLLPPGFKYVAGTARVNNVAAEPVVTDRELRWNAQTLAGNSTTTYQIVTVVGAGVTQGDRINTAVARSGVTAAEISNRAQAIVSIVPSAIFDCAEIIGKVFDDKDGDGYQDNGEPGIPAARVATVNGQLVTADEYGRYHITCAAVPDAQIGSNFVLKLDTRTITEGYAPTSDNPQSIRLTRGKISELNFGVQKARVVSVAVDARAFLNGSAQLQPAFAQRIEGLKTVEAQRLVIQITYGADANEADSLVEARLASIREQVAATFRTGWDGPPPVIEANMVRALRAQGRE